jgi:hypothetical protein
MPLIGTPDALFDHQEATLVYRCDACGRRGLRSVAVRIPLTQLSLPALRLGLEASAAEPPVPCGCGQPRAGNRLQAATLNYQFLQGRVCLRLDAKLREGIVVGMRYAKVTVDGVAHPLGERLDEEQMLLAFGRPLSLRAAWDFFLRRTLETHEGQVLTFPGFAMVTAPPGRRMAAALQSNAELARMAVGEDALVVPLTEVDQLAARPDYTYHTWLSAEMAQAVAKGEVAAAVVVRPGAVIHRFGAALTTLKLRWHHVSLMRLRVDGFGVFYQVPDLDWLTWDITMRGYSIDEVAAIKAALVEAELRGMEAHRARLAAALPGWQVAVEEHPHRRRRGDDCLARVQHPNGNTFWVNLATMWRKGRDPEAFTAHVEQLRGVLERKPERLDRCACGRPAYVTKKWKSHEWLKRAEASGPRLLQQPALGQAAVYARDCPYHSMYLADTGSSGGPSQAQLEQRFQSDLARHVFAMDFALERRGDRVDAIALWGSNIASVGLDAGLVAGLLASVGLDWRGIVCFRAASTNALALGRPRATAALLAASERAVRAAVDHLGDAGDLLDVQGELELAAPAGRFERLRRAA